VLQPHSVPLEFLAETGLVGAVLAIGAVGLLLVGAARALRRLVPGPERAMAAALFAASAAWAWHCLYDWDWDIPGVTLPALAFAAILCARGGRAAGAWARLRETAPGASRAGGLSGGGLSTAGRAAAVGAAALLLGTVAISAALPSWAESESSNALISVAHDSSPAQLRRAQASADFASRLDPLSADPLLAASAIALRRGRVFQARTYLLRAAGREPDDVEVWLTLAGFEAYRDDFRNARAALVRALALDPRNRLAPFILATQEGLTAPAATSATATGTPLVAYAGQGPSGGVAGAIEGGLSALGTIGNQGTVPGANEARPAPSPPAVQGP
jgi:tetratricopeptide (TPR) repeat protein